MDTADNTEFNRDKPEESSADNAEFNRDKPEIELTHQERMRTHYRIGFNRASTRMETRE